MTDIIADFPHCGRLSCQCTHTAGCEAGWLNSQLVAGHVAPCPVCRGDRLPNEQEGRDPRRMGRRQWLARLRETNAKTVKNTKAEEW